MGEQLETETTNQAVLESQTSNLSFLSYVKIGIVFLVGVALASFVTGMATLWFLSLPAAIYLVAKF